MFRIQYMIEKLYSSSYKRQNYCKDFRPKSERNKILRAGQKFVWENFWNKLFDVYLHTQFRFWWAKRESYLHIRKIKIGSIFLWLRCKDNLGFLSIRPDWNEPLDIDSNSVFIDSNSETTWMAFKINKDHMAERHHSVGVNSIFMFSYFS